MVAAAEEVKKKAAAARTRVIAQFYATLFIEEAEDVRAMHWMMEGEWYHNTTPRCGLR
jgi:hypothetical protein